MHIRYMFAVFFSLVMSSNLLLGTASWEAILPCGLSPVAKPLAVPSDVPGANVTIQEGSYVGTAITPDGTKALIACTTEVAVLDLTLPVISVTPVGGFTNAAHVAITPDGTRALVTDSVAHVVGVLNLTVSPVVVESWVTVPFSSMGVAITPVGTKAVVGVWNSVDETSQIYVLDIGPTVQYAYTVDTTSAHALQPTGIAITPDGTKALAAFSGNSLVAVLDLASPTITYEYQVPVGINPQGVAITPDGAMALVSNRGDGTLSVLDLTQSPILPGYTVPADPNDPLCTSIAITPDGTRAYVANASDSNWVDVFNLTTTPIEYIDKVHDVIDALGIAITPDQAPTSVFTFWVNGLTVSFNGSSSSSPIGSIARYDWDFGDGHTGSSTSPTIAYTYGGAGIFTVTLTVTNTGGTSTRQTFTGQTVSNNGLPRAQSAQTITVSGEAMWEAILGSYLGHAMPLAIPSNVLGDSVHIPTGIFMGTAITPDGTKALIGCATEVDILDLTQPIITVTRMTGFTQASGVAITPDGTRALVTDPSTNAVAVLNLLSSPITVESWISSVGLGPMGVAITPHGDKALVALNGDPNYLAAVLNIGATVQFSYKIDNPGGSWYPYDVAVTPDGTKALMTEAAYPGYLVVFDLTLPTFTIEDTLSVGNKPYGVAITPDGTMALVTNRADQTLNVLDLTQPHITSGYTVPASGFCENVAITPDGTRAYVPNWDGDDETGPIDVFNLKKTPIEHIDEIANLYAARGIAITPDQAPTSVFTFSVNNLTVCFDGGGSSSPVGAVTQYRWNFGDGTPVTTTTSSTVCHTYGSSGTYTVSLTVVNSGGTSTDVTFTGQTISNRGLPRARSTQTITAGWQGPASFSGKARLTCRKKAVLKTQWSPNGTNVRKYEIFARHKKIATVKPNKGNHKKIRLSPRHVPHKVSRKYKGYLHRKYGIRGVSIWGEAGPIVKLNVK